MANNDSANYTLRFNEVLQRLEYISSLNWIAIPSLGGGVSSVNSLTGAITLAAGSDISITPSGNTLTISATGAADAVLLNPTTDQTITNTGFNFNVLNGNTTLGAAFSSLPADGLFNNSAASIYTSSSTTPSTPNSLQVAAFSTDNNAISQSMNVVMNYNPSANNQGGYIQTQSQELILSGTHGTTDVLQNFALYIKNAGDGVSTGGTYSEIQNLNIGMENDFGTIQHAIGILIGTVTATTGEALHINNQGSTIKAIQVDGGMSEFDGPVVIETLPPATSSSAGHIGQITWDTNFIYVCIATNTWRRVAIATW